MLPISISGSATVQRTPLQFSAAQRLEMLHDSLDMQGTDMRYSRGDGIAARRAQFLKETVRSNISSASTGAERAPNGRSTPMPNGYMVSFNCSPIMDPCTRTLSSLARSTHRSYRNSDYESRLFANIITASKLHKRPSINLPLSATSQISHVAFNSL